MSDGATTRFGYDGGEIVLETDGANAVLRRYVKGAGADETLVWYEGSGTSSPRWLYADERGSVVAITDGAGSPLATNTYDEYGRPGSGNLGRFQYTGQAYIASLGLYYYKARFYAPSLGKFLQPDPIGYAGGMNLYAYVGGDPVNHRDPKGLKPGGLFGECGWLDPAICVQGKGKTTVNWFGRQFMNEGCSDNGYKERCGQDQSVLMASPSPPSGAPPGFFPPGWPSNYHEPPESDWNWIGAIALRGSGILTAMFLLSGETADDDTLAAMTDRIYGNDMWRQKSPYFNLLSKEQRVYVALQIANSPRSGTWIDMPILRDPALQGLGRLEHYHTLMPVGGSNLTFSYFYSEKFNQAFDIRVHGGL